MNNNTKQARQRLHEAGYQNCDKCLHCTFTKTTSRDGGEEWVYEANKFHSNILYCRKHQALVYKQGICAAYRIEDIKDIQEV